VTPTAQRLVTVPDGLSKTRMLYQLALRGALDPLIRDTATRLASSTSSDLERLRRIHRFVRDGVPYFREPIEMFAPPAFTLRHGGDCDDHTSLIGALAWALRYPFAVEDVGNPRDPEHYTARIGYPAHDSPAGDARTRWIPIETTLPTLFAEHVRDAARRLR
jgi:hypothetical protein